MHKYALLLLLLLLSIAIEASTVKREHEQ